MHCRGGYASSAAGGCELDLQGLQDEVVPIGQNGVRGGKCFQTVRLPPKERDRHYFPNLEPCQDVYPLVMGAPPARLWPYGFRDECLHTSVPLEHRSSPGGKEQLERAVVSVHRGARKRSDASTASARYVQIRARTSRGNSDVT